MILNPVIQGGSEKEYKIIDNAGLNLPAKARPGSSILLETRADPGMFPTVTGSNGLDIPVTIQSSYPEIKQVSKKPMGYVYCIMPAQDITVTFL